MTDTTKERTYTDAEVKDRLQRELPHWYLEGGWIRRNTLLPEQRTYPLLDVPKRRRP